MAIFTYARVSTTGQNIESQLAELQRLYPDAIVYQEKKTGTKKEGRLELDRLMQDIQSGDTLVCYKICRLARNLRELLELVEQLQAKGVNVKFLDLGVDTNTIGGKLMVQILGAFAEFETNQRKERQRIGIDHAMNEGKFKGKQPNRHKYAIIEKYIREGRSTNDIIKLADTSRSTIQRVKRAMKNAA